MKKNDFYVYLLIDPRDNKVFYVGKGKGSRAKAHEEEAKKGVTCNQVKVDTINEINSSGFTEPITYIYAQNLTEELAFAIEDMQISFYRSLYNDKLTNIQAGHQSIYTMDSEEVIDMFGTHDMFEPNEYDRILFIKAKNSFDYSVDDKVRYEKYRHNWKISPAKLWAIDTICVVYNNVIKHVIETPCWMQENPPINRFTFSGEVDTTHKYVGKSIANYIKPDGKKIFGKGAAIGYINL